MRDVQCAYCDDVFKTPYANQKYCSLKCRLLDHKPPSHPKMALYKRKHKPYERSVAPPFINKTIYNKTCPICGNVFESTNKITKYCNVDCRNIQQQIDHRRHAEKQKELRIAYKATHPKLTKRKHMRLRFQILLRDNFHCQYCGRGIEDGIKLQIDHVTPVSKNGQHNKENYITACRDCNLGKSDVLVELNEYQKAQLNKPIPSDVRSDAIPATTDGV